MSLSRKKKSVDLYLVKNMVTFDGVVFSSFFFIRRCELLKRRIR